LGGVRKDFRKLGIVNWKKEALERNIWRDALEEQRLELQNSAKKKKILTYCCKL
jgi:hypothetical protein